MNRKEKLIKLVLFFTLQNLLIINDIDHFAQVMNIKYYIRFE